VSFTRVRRVRVVLGSDEHTTLIDGLERRLRDAGADVQVIALGAPWPEVGRAVGLEVASGRVERGIVCCWTGTGVSIAANKVPGVRAALCADAETARGARRWNDANVLALSLRLTSDVVAGEIVDAFLSTEVDAGEAGTIAAVE
jgi:ribose 5-phosphate isomerase B